MSMDDTRAFVCKFVDCKACFVAYNKTEMKKEVSAQLVETWLLDDGRKLEVCEVLYSRAKTLRFLADKSLLMHGPDLYHVYFGNLLLVNIWQPMYLPNTVEMVDLTSVPETTMLLQIETEPNTMLRTKLHSLLETKYKQKIQMGAANKFKVVLDL
jgi:hypothetical protein